MSFTQQPMGPPPGMPPGAPGAPPQMPGPQPNPAYAQWLQQAQQVQAIIVENAKRQKAFDDAVALIKKDGIHGFRLDIEADSTIAPDEQAEKAQRIEFMQQFVPMMETIIPQAQGNPVIASLAKEVVLFAVRGFPVARPVEEAIERAFDQLSGMPPNPNAGGKGKGAAPQNPQLENAKIQADIHDTQTKAQVDMMGIAQKQQQAAQDAQVRMAQVAAEDQRSRAEQMMSAAELAQRERLEAARIQHMAARNLQGLT